MKIVAEVVRAIKERRLLRAITNKVSGKTKTVENTLNIGYVTYHSSAEPLYCPWLVDEGFQTIYRKIADHTSVSIDRCYILYCFAKQSVLLDGDFIECGVWKGGSSHMLAYILDELAPNKRLLAFDSFTGFPEPSDKDKGSVFFGGGHNNVSFKDVRKMLSAHKCTVNIYKGYIPETFVGLENTKYCFAHIDLDIYQSHIDALNYVYPRVVPSGYILFDDYGFKTCPGARKAVDEFFQNKSEIPIPLPSGQAAIIKLS